MHTPTPGISFRETMEGDFVLGQDSSARLAMHANVDIADLARFVSDPQHPGNICGHIDYPPLGYHLTSTQGVFQLFAPSGEAGLRWMVYEMGFQTQGKSYYLAGKKEVRVGSIFCLWRATTTLYTNLHEGNDTTGPVVGTGVLSLGVIDLLKLARTLEATHTTTLWQSCCTVARFFGFFANALWQTYVRKK